jgi:hypothetical protein
MRLFYSLKPSLNYCFTIETNYNPFIGYEYYNDIYRYKSKQRRLLKNNCIHKCEDHHIIPKSLEKHSLIIETNFPIHCSKNLKVMPSEIIKSNILTHSHHPYYNKYILNCLNEIQGKHYNIDDKRNELISLIDDLYIKLNHKNTVPWNKKNDL